MEEEVDAQKYSSNPTGYLAKLSGESGGG